MCTQSIMQLKGSRLLTTSNAVQAVRGRIAARHSPRSLRARYQ